jgi:ATP-dependent Clp protease ATP-binding subunit ClpA
MFERFAQGARDAVFLAIDEAGRRGDRRVGTDHLLVGVLHDPQVAQLLGVGDEAARLVADDLDRRSLARIGIDVGAFGELAPAVGAARLPFTAGTKVVLKRTLALTVAEKARRIQARHLLLAILERNEPDPAAELLAGLHITKQQARSTMLAPQRW